VEHVKIFRFESALFFANSEYFKTSLYKLTGADPSVMKKLKRKAEKEKLKIQVISKKSLTAAGVNVGSPVKICHNGQSSLFYGHMSSAASLFFTLLARYLLKQSVLNSHLSYTSTNVWSPV
jgi:hypothetical protein